MINFTIQSISMEGFRSFREAQTFQVNRAPGLYFICGENHVDQDIGANGSGKSSIWDALCWCLFGKTVNNLRGQVIINWGSKTCKVSVTLFKEGTEYTITRTSKPSSLTIDPPLVVGGVSKETIVQEDINEFLNLDWEKFIYALIVGQSGTTFLDLGPTDKLDLFSSVMSLTFWEHCSKKAKDSHDIVVKRAQALAVQKGGITPRLEALNASRAALGAKSDEFEHGRAGRLGELDEKATELLAKIAKIEVDEKGKRFVKENKVKIVEDLKFALERIQSNIANIEPQRDTFGTNIISDKSTIASLTKEFNKWKDMQNAACPYCAQEVQAQTIKDNKQKLSKEIAALQKQVKENTTMLGKLSDQLKVNTDKYEESGIALSEAHVVVAGVDEELGVLSRAKDLTTQEVRQIRQQIDEIRAGTNPFTSLLEANKKELIKAQADLEEVEKEIELNNRDVIGFEFWMRGFKELRLWVISDALLALEMESNSVLSKLGLVDWKIKYQMERETTTGEISKGFHALVHSKDFKGSEFVPFHNWSGGEKQRLRIAGVKGVSSLIQAWKGLDFNFAVWDEPASYLSEEGIDDLLRFLEEEALEQGKAIYLIDQRHLESPYFSGIIKVEKLEEGSKIYDV